jgi:hypothetical protein
MLLAEITATLWFLAFGACVRLVKTDTTLFDCVAAAFLVVACLILSAVVMGRIIIRAIL